MWAIIGGFTGFGYVIKYTMPDKTTKTLSLPIEVAERLEEEDNQSAVVAELLRREFDL